MIFLIVVLFLADNGQKRLYLVHKNDLAFINSTNLVISSENGDQSIIIMFEDGLQALNFKKLYTFAKKEEKNIQLSDFDERTEDNSAEVYFQFYGMLHQQQNMLQDYVRTSTYQSAFLTNSIDFKDKVVMDVGAGTGILSFFAIQAGAKKVYAIEASSMALNAKVIYLFCKHCFDITILGTNPSQQLTRQNHCYQLEG